MSRTRLSSTTTALLLLATGACHDPTSPIKPHEPSFAATVSGGTARTLSGGAVFATDANGFALALVQVWAHAQEDTVKHAVYFRARTSATLQPGEYAIIDGNYEGSAVEAGVVLDGDGDDPLLCYGTAGALRVVSVNATRLDGRFSMTATCAHVSGETLPTPITVTGTFVAGRGTLVMDDEELAVAGATYVLVAIDGTPLPYLYRDHVIPGDQLRMRTWIEADTIRFRLDGQLENAGHTRQLEESTETQEVLDDWGWDSWRGGYFRQNGGNVAVAWAYVTPPSDDQYTDTLQVHHGTLTRRALLPPACFRCPAGPEVEWRYKRL